MLGELNVMVVEDEALLGMDISMTLEDEGASVCGPFLTVEEALAGIAGTMAVDVAILDVDLNGELVFPVADRLVQSGTPFVFHTGRSNLDVIRQRYGREVSIVAKPASPEALVEQVNAVTTAA